jgi:predicted metal-dependent peptidase
MAITEHDAALSKAKIGLMSAPNSVFFSSVCMGLAHIWDEAIETAGTNGIYVKYAPSFFMKIKKDERIGLIIHEVLHVALLHMVREGERDHDRWNAAADYVINLIILDAGFKLPPGGLVDRQYAGMSTEEVYKLLPEGTKPSMPDLVPPSADDLPSKDSAGKTQAQVNAIVSANIQSIVINAAAQSKQQGDKPGTVPGEIQVKIDKILNPIVPWHRVLNSFMTKRAKTDYTFRKPNRRYFPDHILPSQYSIKMCDIGVAVDVSASVTDAEFQHYISETAYILKQVRPDVIHFVQFDTKIKTDDKLKKLRDLREVNFHGRGGTKINPVMQWADKNKPAVLIIFSDGKFTAPSINPRIPIIWVIDNNANFTAPFGKVIHFNFLAISKG